MQSTALLSEQFRTRSMQERRYFDQYRNSQIQPGFSINPPPLIVQNPDASLSGPVYIPKIYNGKNKTFFFYGMSDADREARQAADRHRSDAGHAEWRFQLRRKRSHPERDLRS